MINIAEKNVKSLIKRIYMRNIFSEFLEYLKKSMTQSPTETISKSLAILKSIYEKERYTFSVVI